MSKFNLGGFLGSSVKEATDSIGEAIDKNFTNKEEAQTVKNKVLTIVTDFAEKISLGLQEISKTEISGNKLQRSWRPILMLTLTFLVFCTWFLFPVLNIFIKDPGASLELSSVIAAMRENNDFWDVIKIGLGVFGGGRTLEKIATRITPAEGVKFMRSRKNKNKEDKE